MIRQLPDAQELAEARAKLYRLLATVYIRPLSSDFLKFMAGWVASSIKAEGSSRLLSEQMRHGLGRLDSFFKKAGGNSGEELERTISVEFTRLFRGVKPLYSPPPPYESVYREETGRVFGELTFMVHQEYRRFGFDLLDSFSGEPPDHLSFELEFMHLLCSREAEAWAKEDEDEALRLLSAEQEFLREHLTKWVPKLCSEVRQHDRVGLFHGLADLTEGWVVFDYEQHLPEIEPPSSTARVTEEYLA